MTKPRRSSFLFCLSSIFPFLAHATLLRHEDGLDTSTWVVSRNNTSFHRHLELAESEYKVQILPSNLNESVGQPTKKVSSLLPHKIQLDDPELIFCYESLQAADNLPRDARITPSEYVTFVHLQTSTTTTTTTTTSAETRHQSFGDLELKYIAMFYSQACSQCIQPNCCLGMQAHINVQPARNDFLQTLTFLCKSIPRVPQVDAKTETPTSATHKNNTAKRRVESQALPGAFIIDNLQCPVV